MTKLRCADGDGTMTCVTAIRLTTITLACVACCALLTTSRKGGIFNVARVRERSFINQRTRERTARSEPLMTLAGYDNSLRAFC